MEKSIVVVSGGMDSTTAVYHQLDKGREVMMLSFDYGQRHSKELEFADQTSLRLELAHEVLQLPNWAPDRSALTNRGQDVPHGHYAEDNMKQTVVPNRNSIMLNLAVGYAMNFGADYVVTAVHAGDHFVYPDCRPVFLTSLNETVRLANEGFNPPRIEAPFVNYTKADIARIGGELEVPWHMTWSCYEGGEIHCGRCGTCVERLEALDEAGESERDETVYADAEYWKEVLDNE